jgi:hypothetical protein
LLKKGEKKKKNKRETKEKKKRNERWEKRKGARELTGCVTS